jgi:hypothetical protein
MRRTDACRGFRSPEGGHVVRLLDLLGCVS